MSPTTAQSRARRAAAMPWSGRDVPHGVIEVNRACNISCDGCYKAKTGAARPLDDIRADIDIMAERRNLASLTLAGGEPLLHGELPAVVAHVAAKGIRPIILTNGSLLTRERLAACARAGAARVALHVDMHQRLRPDAPAARAEEELNPLRRRYIALCDEAGLATALQMTLYRDNLAGLGDVLALGHAVSPRTTAMLVTLYSPAVDAGGGRQELALHADDVVELMARAEGALPVSCVPSSHDRESPRWLFYLAFVTVGKRGIVRKRYLRPGDGRTLRFLLRLQRKARGRFTFEETRTPGQNLAALLAFTLLSRSPRALASGLALLAAALANRNLKTFTLLVQQGPNLREDGSYETCRDCPDATVRDGRLVPVCLADRLAPERPAPAAAGSNP